MFNKSKSDYINFILLTGIIILIIEISFFNSGLIFSLIISIGCIYYSRKQKSKTFWKLVFWFGWISLVITVLNMMTIKFLLLAVLIYLIIQFLQSKKNPNFIKPTVEPKGEPLQEALIKREPFFKNTFFGRQKSPEYVYEWDDINIQCGVGDSIVDLSYTVLPEGESVIFIRNIIGNVHVYVPYEVEVKVSHSAIYGSSTIFENVDLKSYNRNLMYQTEQYDHAKQKIKIITSMVVGDLEVKRV